MNELLYFAYANSPEEPLKALTVEDNLVNTHLSERANLADDFNIHRESYATIPSISQNLAKFKEKICLFHFSGHAGNDQLIFEDQEANSEGIGELLLQCPNLRLVILNGCSTIGQVKTLLNEKGEKGIPVVVATSRPVNDELATKFADIFYRRLAEFDNIGQAFNTAMATLKITEDIHYDNGTERGVINRKGKKKNETIWGLYARNKDYSNFDWKLPTKGVLANYIEFTPNKPLFKGLFLELAEYKTEIAELLREEKRLKATIKSIPEKNILVLKSLPHTISEQLRKLLASGNGDSAGIFFNKLNIHRLDQLLWTYQAAIKLVVFALVAQFWDIRKSKTKKLKEQEKEIISSIFQPNEVEGQQYTYEKLIQFLMESIISHKGSLFLAELMDPKFQFHDSQNFKESCTFLDSKAIELKETEARTSLQGDTIKLHRLCKDVEEHLSTVLSEVIFLSNYRLASIKDINVRKQRNLVTPQFLHQVIDLEHSILNNFDLGIEILEEFMDNSSVILSRCDKTNLIEHNHQYVTADKEDKQPFYLNLSPFIFDENAYNKKAPIAKILFFKHYVKSDNSLIYSHIYNLNDEHLIVKDKTAEENFEDIRSQLDAFTDLIFNQKLEEAF